MAFGSNRASGFWETKGSKWRLGAWAASEEEPKPMRGTRDIHKSVSRGLGSVNTLKPTCEDKGHEGSAKAIAALAFPESILCGARQPREREGQTR
jgi:hypothetical protein